MTFFVKIPILKLPVEYCKLNGGDRAVVREVYIDQQKGLCYYCNSDLRMVSSEEVLKMKVTSHLYPKGFFDTKNHLHHDHDTGLTLGVVHAHCNAVLWEYHNE